MAALTITMKQFEEGIKAIGGTVILTITADIVPKMNKTKNPYYGRVHKRVIANGRIGANVVDAGPHMWAQVVSQHFIYSGDKSYIRFIETSRKETYYVDKKVVDKSVLIPFLPVEKNKEELIKYRNFKVSHIVSVRWRGDDYIIR